MTDTRLHERNQAEIERSASEAAKVVLKPSDRVQIERYLDPPEDTPYALEYAFHLLGNVRDKTVVDLGCGTGENLIPLVEHGARVIGLDISPDLIAIAHKRLNDANLHASVSAGDAYNAGLPDESVDVILRRSDSPSRYKACSRRNVEDSAQRRSDHPEGAHPILQRESAIFIADHAMAGL